MDQTANTLEMLIQATFRGPVFGPDNAFGAEAAGRIPDIKNQVARIAHFFKDELTMSITNALPNADEAVVARLLKEITPKSVTFCPALTAGELLTPDNTRRLAGAASAIGIMYFADQSVDRGDDYMVQAIEYLCGKKQPQALQPEVTARLTTLQRIRTNIEKFALPEDAPYVLDCYDQQVLANEAVLHTMSNDYLQASPKARQTMLNNSVEDIARRMIIDAGFPSVTASLYAIYRQNDPSLVPLGDIHHDPGIKKLLQFCNVIVRIADELGDYDIDAGNHPEWGTFSINPFNQYHQRFFEIFCDQADIRDPRIVERLQQTCKAFSKSHHDEQIKMVDSIAAILFEHARYTFETLPRSLVAQHALYVQLCKRVLEIGHVNMAGDKALAGF